MHARRPRVQALEQRGRGLRHVVACCLSGMAHLISLRRHDPDQVRWVGRGLSVRHRPDTPRDCCRLPNPRGPPRQACGPAVLQAGPIFAALLTNRRIAMTPFFVQIKCELGKAYQVANELAEAEIASEIYSTAGDYDLLVKFYVDAGTDIGHFVNEKVQILPGIKDTYTIITFKAFMA
jgi:DNA-binding Lrp family transcriptional regulator